MVEKYRRACSALSVAMVDRFAAFVNIRTLSRMTAVGFELRMPFVCIIRCGREETKGSGL